MYDLLKVLVANLMMPLPVSLGLGLPGLLLFGLATAVGRLSDSSGMRLMEGIRLWRQRPELPLIVSGASRDPDIAPVAQGYADAAAELGVPEDRLVVLDTPTDTGREASAVHDVLGEGSQVVVVTSASHMPRAIHHFQQAGLLPVSVGL
ncbi:YdcF family protein [Halomonas sp.]|uniref:YdcF family protein n=1 Tax=Halomonas sp. TaxID=1486246 RepID=UPI003D0F62EC